MSSFDWQDLAIIQQSSSQIAQIDMTMSHFCMI